MKTTEQNLSILTTIFTACLITSNVVTSKLVNTGLTIHGIPIVLPGAVLCYALTFLITDVIGELWGKSEANHCVKLGLIAQVVATILICLTRFIPAYDPEIGICYNKLLGQNYIFLIGSLTAYTASQAWDVYIFHKVRNFILSKTNNKGLKWIWNNISTISSQLLDTFIFIGISFGIGYGWFWNNLTLLLIMILGQYLFKVILAILDTPIFYLMTKEEKNGYRE